MIIIWKKYKDIQNIPSLLTTDFKMKVFYFLPWISDLFLQKDKSCIYPRLIYCEEIKTFVLSLQSKR